MKMLSGVMLERSRTSLSKSNPPSRPWAFRPCDQTKYRVEPGRYSQRSTVLERNCLKLKSGFWKDSGTVPVQIDVVAAAV